ncbi:hypothetical protein, partial [Nonomuraea zeae]|uniref:hypothetical protein n=1 Tax=Nonomuraea zeae TaxID=1642303 RepID=UPI00197CEA59
MIDVTIRRLSVTTHGTPQDGVLVGRLLADMAAERLDRALRGLSLPAGIWCVRRIDVRVPLDLARTEPGLAEEWAAALARSLPQALATGTDVVHYAHLGAALADLVRGAATGQVSRMWAWQQAGALRDGDPRPDANPAAAVLTVLRRHRAMTPAVLTSAILDAGLPALHRLLGESGWQAVAGLLPGIADPPAHALGAQATATRTSDSGPAHPGSQVPLSASEGSGGLDSTVLASPMADGSPVPDGVARPVPGEGADADVRALAGQLLALSPLTELIRRSGLRPSWRTRRVWAFLAVLAADPSLATGSGRAAAVIAAAADLLADDSPQTSPVPARVPDRASHELPCRDSHSLAARAPYEPGEPNESGARDRHWESDAPNGELDLPGEDRADHGHRTRWAGLLFLLGTARAAGLPDAVLADPVFATRPLPWVLQGLALRLIPVSYTHL